MMIERSGGRARGRALREIWLTTTAMGTGLFLCSIAPNSALAACTTTTGSGIYFCSGTTSWPGLNLLYPPAENVTVTVEAGATVLGGGANPVTDPNAGPYAGPPSVAAIGVGANSIINNGGAVTGGEDAIVSQGGDLTVNNTASVTANGGIAIRSDGSVSVNSTGSISGQIGVQAAGAATVVNSGTISGPTGGTFQGVAGLSVSLVNSGTISTAYVGVNAGIGGATVINQGTIRVTEALSAAISSNGGLTLDNSGNISGSVSTLDGDTAIANKGTIDGGRNIGIYTAGALTLNNNAGGLVSSSGADISTVGASSIIIVNDGTIKSTGAGGSGVTAYTNLSGTNNGSITAGNNGAGIHAFQDMTLTNKGTITTGNTTGLTSQAVAVRADNILNLTNQGVISTGTTGANIAVQAGAAANVVNSNKITAGGADSYGILSGGDVTLRNSGTITATGAAAIGVYAGGSSNVANSGSIIAEDTAVSTKYLSVVSNTGTITAGIVGVTSENDVRVTNSNSILAPIGVQATGGATIVNSGKIGSGGTGSVGVTAGRAVDVTNSGTITGETGILVTDGGASSTITNSGAIIGSGGTAIQLTNAADTVTLTKSSRVQGLIALGGGGDTVNVETSKSAGSQVIVFDTLEGARVNVSGDRPATVIGNQIVVVDTSNFIVEDSALRDVTGAVSNLVQRRNGNATSNKPSDTTRGFWIQGIGGGRNQQASSSLTGWRHTFGGVIAGYETAPFLDYRIGAFAGASYGSTRINNTPDRANGTYAFAGIYGRYQPGAFFVDFNLVGGYAINTAKRNVTSNIVAGGSETASSRASGVFFAPQIGLGYRMQYDQSGTITPFVKVRYLAAQYGANAESGTTAPINVAARSSHSLEVRAELEMSRVRKSANGTSLRMYQTVGVVSETRITNGVVNASILGTQISLTTPGPRNEFAGYFGAGVEWTSARGATLFANFEAEVRLDRSIAGNARAGAMWTF